MKATSINDYLLKRYKQFIGEYSDTLLLSQFEYRHSSVVFRAAIQNLPKVCLSKVLSKR